jgi:hypothetical protein
MRSADHCSSRILDGLALSGTGNSSKLADVEFRFALTVIIFVLVIIKIARVL